MSVIVNRVAEHAAAYPDKPALVSFSQTLSYAQVLTEIHARSKAMRNEAPWDPTFQKSASVIEQILSGLARLALGRPIIGQTSGSVGQAKTYCRSQHSWQASFQASDVEFGIHHLDVVAAPGQLTHSLFSYAVCHGLSVGATVLVADSYRPDRVLAQLRTHHATVLYGVPTQLSLLVSAIQGDSINTVRWVLSSGARWFGQLLAPAQQAFPRAQIAEFYGASETSFITVANHTHDKNLPAGSVGRAFTGVTLQAEPHDGGRIWASSPALFDSYRDDPPIDFYERVDAEGTRWVSVGDLGRVDAAGYLFLMGRESRKIVTSGKNLYPDEVEACLTTHPAVLQAAVFGVSDARRGERLMAAIRLQSQDQSPPAVAWVDQGQRNALISHLRPMLDDYKIPRQFLAVSPWPWTDSGKTDFVRLQSVVENQAARSP